MKSYSADICVSGIGVTSSIGQGKKEFTSALLEGRHAFDVMHRSGRQNGTKFLGAEIKNLLYPDHFSKRVIRTASFSGQVAMVTLHEAWEDANLKDVDPLRIGLIAGGSNVQQRELVNTYDNFKDKLSYIRPTYGISFMDTDICGLCTEQYGIKGFAYSLGGASASGQMAIIQGIQAIKAEVVDVCIVIGTLMDLSYWELQSLQSLGAMGSKRFGDEPALACRPFDKSRDGFIYGESCGVLVLERAGNAMKRNVTPYANIKGWSIVMDANRKPNPSLEGEILAISKALEVARLASKDIDYVNPHGSGSVVGDKTELMALKDCNLEHSHMNTTKSITGHGLSAAGAVEVIGTLLQMKEEKLHPSRNLENPVDDTFNWVKEIVIPHRIKNALSLSLGFGGINTAICIENY